MKLILYVRDEPERAARALDRLRAWSARRGHEVLLHVGQKESYELTFTDEPIDGGPRYTYGGLVGALDELARPLVRGKVALLVPTRATIIIPGWPHFDAQDGLRQIGAELLVADRKERKEIEAA